VLKLVRAIVLLLRVVLNWAKGISSSSRHRRGSPPILGHPLWSSLAGVVVRVKVFELEFEVFDIS